jgi:hypothetical protein
MLDHEIGDGESRSSSLEVSAGESLIAVLSTGLGV